MADVSITIALEGLATIQSALGSLGNSFSGLSGSLSATSAKLEQIGASLASVGAKVTAIAAPAALLGKSLIESGADFETAMNKIRVASGASSEQMDQVAEAAKRIGAATTFSAGDAADALIALAKNGISVDDALGGALDATVNLAAATKTDLATAADIAAKAVQQFGASAAAAPAMMDQLFNATQASTFELGDMAQALGQAGGVAAQAGLSFGELNTALVTVSPSFFSGSDAGTSLKNMLVNLVPQTKSATAEMEALGLKFTDAQGKFLPMRDIVGQLHDAFLNLTDAQKVSAAQTLFGTDSMRAALSLAEGGVAAWDKNTAAINQQATASKAAAEMMKGFWGALEQVRGTVELVGIALLKGGFIDFLTAMAVKLADGIAWLSQANPRLVAFAAGLTTLAVAAGPIALLLGGIATALGLLLSPIGLVVAAVAGLAGAWILFGDKIEAALATVIDTVKGWAGELVAAVEGAVTDARDAAVGVVKGMAGDVTKYFADIPSRIRALGSSIVGAITRPFEQASDEVVGHSIVPEMITACLAEFKRLGGGVREALDRNIQDWGNWGESAGRVVEDMSQGAKQSLAGLFATGETSLEQWKNVFVNAFANEGANAVVAFVSMGIEQLSAFATGATQATGAAASGMEGMTAATGGVTAAMGPLGIATLGVGAAVGILALAGVNLGDIFGKIADLVGGALKAAFDAFMAVVSAIAAVFSALNDILQAFVGWIGTIGKELGKGDLKDLLKIFSGGGIFEGIIDGIGDIFGGIFGGLFHEGGWVGGSGDVPIIAKTGEFVVNPEAAARNAALLEAINSGSSMHEMVQQIAPGGELIQVSRAGPALAGGGETTVYNFNGAMISDALSTSNLARQFSRHIRAEDRRLRGRPGR